MNPDIINKNLINRKLSINDFKTDVKAVLEKALPRCLNMEIAFIIDANYNKKYNLCFPPDRLGLIRIELMIDENEDNFYYLPYQFNFSFVNFSKRTLGGYCYDDLDKILTDDLYNELNNEYLKYKQEYKYNVIKCLFFDGRYFKYKDFPLKYSYTDGNIFEHPIDENDTVTANFAKVISIDDKGFYYTKKDNPKQKDYALFENLDFTFDLRLILESSLKINN